MANMNNTRFIVDDIVNKKLKQNKIVIRGVDISYIWCKFAAYHKKKKKKNALIAKEIAFRFYYIKLEVQAC